jgi:chemotaxis signal transduction protein
MRLVELECRGQRIGLPLACVRRAVVSALPASLPGASDIVLGVLNVEGELVAVVDFARRLGLPPAPIVPAQRLLLVELSGCLAGVLADQIHGVTERTLEAPLPRELGAAEFVSGAVRLPDGLCLVVDPDRFLFPHEVAALSAALAGAADHAH